MIQFNQIFEELTMQLIVIMIGLLLHNVCFTRLLENKQKYDADEITWKRLKEYLGSAYEWSFAGSVVGLFLIAIGFNWNVFTQLF